VRLAHSFALENPLIAADCIEATEFPELAGKYRVYAVPKTVINEEASFEGALPEEFFLERVLEAAPPPASSAPQADR
jgi:Thioredoxin domain